MSSRAEKLPSQDPFSTILDAVIEFRRMYPEQSRQEAITIYRSMSTAERQQLEQAAAPLATSGDPLGESAAIDLVLFNRANETLQNAA